MLPNAIDIQRAKRKSTGWPSNRLGASNHLDEPYERTSPARVATEQGAAQKRMPNRLEMLLRLHRRVTLPSTLLPGAEVGERIGSTDT